MATITEKHPLVEAEQIFDILNTSYDDLENAIYSKNNIQQWFKTYLLSDGFTSLNPTEKIKTFEAYERLKFVLEQLINYDIENIWKFLNTQAIKEKLKLSKS